MSILIGNVGLCLAVLTALAALALAVVSAGAGMPGLLRAARWLLVGFFAMLTLSSLGLLGALIDSDFRIKYVVHFTETHLPMGYKIAAFWAGQEGSLLLWAWMLGAMVMIVGIIRRNMLDVEQGVVTATLALICLFFATLMLFAANPFEATPTVSPEGVPLELPTEGQGLNPMLQDPGMIAHPPMLFAGYAGFAVPFAFLVGALAVGRRDNWWIASTRYWILASWLFLSIGILLGAQWAYVELGWGGYWAWDPVENASLLPWLTATALLHSIGAQQHRGVLKVSNASLISLSFILCIFGTFITRSGVVQSVHSFGKSLVGTFFLVFLVLLVLAALSLVLIRLDTLKSERPIEDFTPRDWGYLLANTLLLLTTGIVTVGTMFPLISGIFKTQAVSVNQSFYNKAVIPLWLVLMAIMSVGPLLSAGRDGIEKLGRGLLFSGPAGVLVAAALWLLHVRDPWALVCGLIVGVAVASIIVDLVWTISQRLTLGDDNAIMAIIYVFDGNHRRYGGQIAHVGMLLMMIGIAGSSLYAIKKDVPLVVGQTAEIGPNKLKFTGSEYIRKPTYEAVAATLVLTDARGRQTTLKPERRAYNKSENPNAQVAIRSTLREDFYTNLAGFDMDERTGLLTSATIQVIISPLVNWLWIGGIVMGLGTLVCLTPRLLPSSAQAELPQGMQQPPPLPPDHIPTAMRWSN